MLPHGAWEFHEHLIPQSDPRPLRIWLEAGENDNGAGSSAAGLHNWVLANQNMAKVLAAKHYHYRFEYAKTAGHVDQKVVSQTLALVQVLDRVETATLPSSASRPGASRGTP
jgi:hypothetical protein